MLSRLGFAIRETGQALDRLGCRLRGSEVYLEESASKLKRRIWFVRCRCRCRCRRFEQEMLPPSLLPCFLPTASIRSFRPAPLEAY
jgi:hypothetical protein